MGVLHRADTERAFVGAFAQSTCGDVSANTDGPRDGTDWLRMRRNAHKQCSVASELYDAALSELPIDGAIVCRSKVVDFSRIEVEEAWLSLMADRHSDHDVDQGSLSAPRFQMYLELLAGVDFCNLASVNAVCDGLRCWQEWNLATLQV